MAILNRLKHHHRQIYRIHNEIQEEEEEEEGKRGGKGEAAAAAAAAFSLLFEFIICRV